MLFVFVIACSVFVKSRPDSHDEQTLNTHDEPAPIDFPSCLLLFLQVSGGELLDSFLRHRRPPFCRTACERRMLSESESGLAALRLTSPSRGMTALWCSLWLSFLLPLCVAPARLPTALPTGRRQYPTHSLYTADTTPVVRANKA